MSFAEGIGSASLNLADPNIMLYVFVAFIVICLLLDLPAIAGMFRLIRVSRRRAKSTARAVARER